LDDALNILTSDPDTAWDAHGNAYYESGDLRGVYHGGDETGTVWRSTDGGRTWQPKGGVAAVRGSEERTELDRPWLAVDNSGGARSTDGARTFHRVVVDGDVHRVSSPDEALPAYTEMIAAIAADPRRPGRVAVAWPEAVDADTSRIVLRSSVDGGQHWSRRLD